MQAQQGRFVTDDGIGVAYHRWGGDDEGPPVVLVHGFMSHARMNWATTGVVEALLEAGRPAVGIDVRGHGSSDKPHEVEAYGQELMAGDVRALVAELHLDAFDLVGYSMGAFVSAIVAVDDDRIGRLVLGGIGAAAVEHGTWDLDAVPRDELVAALRADDPATISHPGAASFRAFADRSGADRLAMAAHAASRQPTPVAFDRIHAPTLVLAGREDPLARDPEHLVDVLPDARLELLDGDHLSATRNPRFAGAIADFLR